MKSTEFLPADYDQHGRLRLPVLFWLILLLQARTWVLFAIAAASRQQGDALLALFYPDSDGFWLGLLPGIPAVMAFFLSGRRQQFPRLWRALRWPLVAAQALLLVWQPALWLAGEPLSATGLLLTIADAFALWWLLADGRLRACFSSVQD